MRNILAILAIAAFAVAAGAQVNTGASDATNAAGQAGKLTASAHQATSVRAQLTKNLDTKKAKVGDEVVARTTSQATLADGMKLPKGSRLIGHVTEVHPKSREDHDAELAFAFDRAVLRDGRQVPVHAIMRSLAAPAALNADEDGMMDAGGGMAPAMGGGGAPAGGGMVAGGGRGLVGGAAGMAGGAAGTTGGFAGGVAGNAAAGLNSGAARADAGVAALGRAGSMNNELGGSVAGAAMPVGNLSGVTFSTVDASSHASRSGVSGSAGTSTATMLTAHGRDFTLAGGSQMTLSLSPQ